jgi:prolyl oligopeptidase
MDQEDTLHDEVVSDPYRWLEDLDSEETRAWVEAQNALTFDYLRRIPQRDGIRSRLEALWNYPRQGVPWHRGARWFLSRNDGLQEHAVMFWREGRDGALKVLLDPNSMSVDGSVSLAGVSVSEDGRYAAYATSEGGSDWNLWRVRDISSGRDLDDRLDWVKFSGVAWKRDGTGFYYSRYPEPEPGAEREQANFDQRLYFHRIGTPQEGDVLVYARPDEPTWGFGSEVTEDGRYLIVPSWVGTDSRKRMFFADLTADTPVRPLFTSFDAAYDFVGNDGSVFYFRTDAEAPRGRVIAVDADDPRRETWRDIIPEGKDPLESVRMIANRLVAFSMRDAHDRIRVFGRDGSLEGEIELPEPGSVTGVAGRRNDTEMFFTFSSFTRPASTYCYDFDARTLTQVWAPAIALDPDRFETRQVWYPSKDGTSIPMFLVHKRGLAIDGEVPVYLYGYGGFNIPLKPGFSVNVITWAEMGGIFAQPALRGGGEYGEDWHQAGMLDRKQNVFDDFIAAAEWLVSEGYTSPGKLAIGGGSNGGLLVGACMTQRPDLFGACLPAVGVMDMLRFHKFTIGWAWIPEYGSPDDPAQFATLRAYSPLHNLRPGTAYPATLITTADHDDRVVPAHSFKFAAALQAAQGGDAPCLIRIETKAGHGAGIPTSKQIEESADRWAFLAHRFRMAGL